MCRNGPDSLEERRIRINSGLSAAANAPPCFQSPSITLVLKDRVLETARHAFGVAILFWVLGQARCGVLMVKIAVCQGEETRGLSLVLRRAKPYEAPLGARHRHGHDTQFVG